MGSTHHRSAVLKRLRETIEKTKDPETLAKLTAQYVKLNAQKRPRKSADEPSAESKDKTSALVDKWANRLSHVAPYGNRIQCSVIAEVEQRRKSRGKEDNLTSTERHILVARVIKEVAEELSAEERAAWEAYLDEEQAAKQAEGLKG